MKRGEIWWASLPSPSGSGPGLRRPVLIVQANPFNDSRIATVVVAAITSNLVLAEAPGNVRLSSADSGLPKPSVVNVSQLLTADRGFLTERVGALRAPLVQRVDDGLRLVLGV
jgi:mRNA interferase MazF